MTMAGPPSATRPMSWTMAKAEVAEAAGTVERAAPAEREASAEKVAPGGRAAPGARSLLQEPTYCGDGCGAAAGLLPSSTEMLLERAFRVQRERGVDAHRPEQDRTGDERGRDGHHQGARGRSSPEAGRDDAAGGAAAAREAEVGHEEGDQVRPRPPRHLEAATDERGRQVLLPGAHPREGRPEGHPPQEVRRDQEQKSKQDHHRGDRPGEDRRQQDQERTDRRELEQHPDQHAQQPEAEKRREEELHAASEDRTPGGDSCTSHARGEDGDGPRPEGEFRQAREERGANAEPERGGYHQTVA